MILTRRAMMTSAAWGVRTKSWTILEIVYVQLRRTTARG